MAPRPPKTQGRAGLPKLRLIVRRLPPGLTEDEFQAALGDEWMVSAGKVDWAAYKEGKISKE
jgi:regulator of nonsense transcripts 3